MKNEFKEEQKFTQWWVWAILIGIGLFFTFGVYKQLINGEEFGNNSMSDTLLLISTILIFGLIILFWLMQLKTEINKDKIKIAFFPFLKRNINWGEIKSTKIVNYGFLGGWGVRFSSKYGTVYNAKGKMGLAVELKNGKKFLIGTQKETELKKVIDAIKPI